MLQYSLPSRARRAAIESRSSRICPLSTATASGLPLPPSMLASRRISQSSRNGSSTRCSATTPSTATVRLEISGSNDCMRSSASASITCVVSLPIRVMWVLPWPQVLTQSPSTRTVSPTRASASASSSSTVRVSPPALAERLQAVMEIAASRRMKMCFIFMESVFGRAGPGFGDRLPERGFMIQR